MISMIAAIARNRAIGLHNKLLYWLPDDLKRFKSLTTGHTIIMGRKTFESFPKGALPNRRNIVLSRNASATFPGAETFGSLEEALAHCPPEEEVFIIGGESVYQAALPSPTNSISPRLKTPHVKQMPSSRLSAMKNGKQPGNKHMRGTKDTHSNSRSKTIYERKEPKPLPSP